MPNNTDMTIQDLEALLSCVDVHTHIAKTILNKEEVTKEERFKVKTYTFGLMVNNGVVIPDSIYEAYEEHFPEILMRGKTRGLKIC